ncbi:MAG: imidazole glycerol phosphate synthase subunit HisH [Tritonibacter mobilis]|nr:imidazole glycerol phosphate synthase subunit HisH [Tritonibacter mobilis]
MLTAIIDYESGNLHSAEKAFQRMAAEVGAGEVVVTSDADVVARADRLVLPGDGAFPACAAELRGHKGIYDAMVEAVEVKGRPFLGICVGMQLMATTGHEYSETPGLGWVGGDVVKITPADRHLKVPHMGWNQLYQTGQHPLWNRIDDGERFYFVHSYYLESADNNLLVGECEYGYWFTSAIARDNVFALQCHPEKSAEAGLQMLSNFVKWDGQS